MWNFDKELYFRLDEHDRRIYKSAVQCTYPNWETLQDMQYQAHDEDLRQILKNMSHHYYHVAED
jgi:hypothetical protein